MYSLDLVDSHLQRCRGVPRSYVESRLKTKDYRNVLCNMDNVEEKCLRTRDVFRRIESRKHELGIVEHSHSVLSCIDQKRFVEDDGIETMAFGHNRIPAEFRVFPTV